MLGLVIGFGCFQLMWNWPAIETSPCSPGQRQECRCKISVAGDNVHLPILWNSGAPHNERDIGVGV